MSPIIIPTPRPRISAAGWPLSKHASIRTPASSPTDSGSKITSTLTRKNYASQSRRGLAFDFVVISSLAEDDAFGFPDALPFYRSENRTPVPVGDLVRYEPLGVGPSRID